MGDKITINVGINSTQYQSGLAAMRKYTSEFKNDVRSQLVGAVGGFALLTAAIGTVKRAFAKGAEMETFIAQFKTLLGSMDAAKQRMKELSDFAASTPFALPEIAAASRTLETLTEGALSTGEGLRIVGDAAATAKRPFEEIAVVIGRVYAGIQQGSQTIGAEINRLIELGLVSNQTKTQLQAMMEQGKKGSEVWALVAADLARFNGQMSAMSDTLEGKISTLGDAWDEMLRRFSKPMLETVKSDTEGVTSSLESLADAAGIVGGAIDGLMKWIQTAFGYIGTAIQSAMIILQGFFDAFDAGIGKAKQGLASLLSFDLGGFFKAWKSGNDAATEAFVEAWKRAHDQVKKEHEAFQERFAPTPEGESGKKGPAQAVPGAVDEEADKAAQKVEDRMERLRKNEEEAMRDKLEGEEKINALIEERDRLLAAADSEADQDKAIDHLEEAQKLQRDIEREEKRAQDAKDAKAKKAAEKKKRAAEEQDEKDRESVLNIANAREDEAKARREDQLEQMTPQQRIAEFTKEKNKLETDAAALEESDPEAAAKKRTEAIELGRKIRDEQGKVDEDSKRRAEEAQAKIDEDAQKKKDAMKSAASVPVSSLQAVGGGGRAGPSSNSDPMLREAQRQTQTLQEVAMLLRQQVGVTSAPQAAPARM